MSLGFTGERIVPGAVDCEPTFAQKMYQEHIARYAFASQVVAGARVLDVGCGVGYGSQFLAKSGAASVLGFDLSMDAIEHARANYFHPAVTFAVQDVFALDAVDDFDVVTCFELIEHVSQQERVVNLIKAALKADGILAISTPRPLDDIRTHFHVHEMNFEEIFSLLKKNFKNVEVYFQKNYFCSVVGSGKAEAFTHVHYVTDQVRLEDSDYFVFLASDGELEGRIAVEPQLSVNDDAYILTLEHDVGVLRRAEADHLARIAHLEAQNGELLATRAVGSAVEAIQSTVLDIGQKIAQVVERGEAAPVADLVSDNLVALRNEAVEAIRSGVAEMEGAAALVAEAHRARMQELEAVRDDALAVLQVQARLVEEEAKRRDEALAAAKLHADLVQEEVKRRDEALAAAKLHAELVDKETRRREDEQIATLNLRLTELAAEHEALQVKAEAQANALAMREADLADARLALDCSREDVERLRRVLLEQSERTSEAETRAFNLQSAAEQLPDAHQRVSALENEINALRYRLDSAEATLARFRQSFSWAVTKPLRWTWRTYRTWTGRSLPK